jgi:uncharacterized protein YkwD
MTKTKKTKRIYNKKNSAKNSPSFTKGLKFLPALSIAFIASFLLISPNLSSIKNGSNVLSYATNTSISGLLSSTNIQRNNNGKSSLTINSALNNAAQAKANDMVNRGYWSHETPDGQQPWIFFTSAGYQYLAAGENLAYGFSDSSNTITGWMNSPPHKENLLSGNYTEVGFGMANTADYCYSGDYDNNPNTPATSGCKGPQTIVVAMYGKPQVASANSTAPSTEATKPVAAKQKATPEATPEPATETKLEIQKETKEEPIATNLEGKAEVTTASQKETTRIQLLTKGNAAWSGSALLLAVCSVGFVWALHRGFHIKKFILAGEHYLAKHLHLDLFVLAVVFLGFVLLASSGAVR